jgi:hypothetical protein
MYSVPTIKESLLSDVTPTEKPSGLDFLNSLGIDNSIPVYEVRF